MNASFLLEQMVSLHGGGLGGEVALDALDISPDGDARAVLVTVVGAIDSRRYPRVKCTTGLSSVLECAKKKA